MGQQVAALGEGGTVGEVVEMAADEVGTRGNHLEEEGGASPPVVTKGGGVFGASRHQENTGLGEIERTETFNAGMPGKCLIHTAPTTCPKRRVGMVVTPC